MIFGHSKIKMSMLGMVVGMQKKVSVLSQFFYLSKNKNKKPRYMTFNRYFSLCCAIGNSMNCQDHSVSLSNFRITRYLHSDSVRLKYRKTMKIWEYLKYQKCNTPKIGVFILRQANYDTLCFICEKKRKDSPYIQRYFLASQNFHTDTLT